MKKKATDEVVTAKKSSSPKKKPFRKGSTKAELLLRPSTTPTPVEQTMHPTGVFSYSAMQVREIDAVPLFYGELAMDAEGVAAGTPITAFIQNVTMDVIFSVNKKTLKSRNTGMFYTYKMKGINQQQLEAAERDDKVDDSQQQQGDEEDEEQRGEEDDEQRGEEDEEQGGEEDEEQGGEEDEEQGGEEDEEQGGEEDDREEASPPPRTKLKVKSVRRVEEKDTRMRGTTRSRDDESDDDERSTRRGTSHREEKKGTAGDRRVLPGKQVKPVVKRRR
jgi:hypothetical protein